MLKALVLAGALAASATPSLAQSAWRDPGPTLHAPRHHARALPSRSVYPRQVEGPLVDGAVVPARISRPPTADGYGDRAVEAVRSVRYVQPYGNYGSWGDFDGYGYGSGGGYDDGYGSGYGRTVNRTTTSVVLGNGSIVTNERVSTGGPVPQNTYGIDGLVPATPLLSNEYYADRGYGYGGRYGRHGYRLDRGYSGGPTIITPAFGTIVDID